MQRGFKTWCENIALQQRNNFGLRAYDPLDPWLLAESKGITVCTANQIPELSKESIEILTVKDKESWSAVTINGATTSLIILNPVNSKVRMASDLMHEMSHLFIGHKAARVDVTEDGILLLNTYSKDQEEEATWLAGCLLLPREALLHIRRRRLSFDEVKRIYGVSKQMYDFRVRMTGVDRQFKQGLGRPPRNAI
ncbi:MAG: ImmA/IrrE family metallo-endopeptidase [Candidatus Nitrospinota bacterium M3_3B_026]